MKQNILGFLLVVCSWSCFAQSADYDFKALSPEDQTLLSNAIELVDGGMSEAVVPDFDMLAKKYPDNFLVQYERIYNLYVLKRYNEVIADRNRLLKNKSANERAYQLIGNAYDLIGNRKKASEIYKKGLKHFPNSGALYMELGTLSLLDNDFQKALDNYNQGIVVDPNFASNYYRGANLYFSSQTGKVWGLVYAETEILLAPSNKSRHQEMAQNIIDCLKECITINNDSATQMTVKLVPSRVIQIENKNNVVYLAFPGIYEGSIMQPLLKLCSSKTPFTCNIQQLIEIRKGLVENYYSITDNIYGNSMYLLEFQKQVIDAGHWDAYNYYLFMDCYPEEFEEWYSSNSEVLDAFIEWYNNAPFRLGDGRSVDPIQIYKSYRPIDLLKAIEIQARLIADGKDSDGNKN